MKIENATYSIRILCESAWGGESEFLSMHESLHVSKCACVCVQCSMVCSGCDSVCIIRVCVCVCPVPLPAHQWVAGPSSLTKTSVFFQEDSHRKVGHIEIRSSLIQYLKWKFTSLFISEQIAFTLLVMTASKGPKDQRVAECDVKAKWMLAEDLNNRQWQNFHFGYLL